MKISDARKSLFGTGSNSKTTSKTDSGKLTVSKAREMLFTSKPTIDFSQYDPDILDTLKQDSSAWTYDLFDAEDLQRKSMGIMPKSVESSYDLDDPIDKYLYEQGYVSRNKFSKGYQQAEKDNAAKANFSTEVQKNAAQKLAQYREEDPSYSEKEAYEKAFEELRKTDAYKNLIKSDDLESYFKNYVKDSMQNKLTEQSEDEVLQAMMDRTIGTGRTLSSVSLPQAKTDTGRQKEAAMRLASNMAGKDYSEKEITAPIIPGTKAWETMITETLDDITQSNAEEKARIRTDAVFYNGEESEARKKEIDKRIKEINRVLNRGQGVQQTYIDPDKRNSQLQERNALQAELSTLQAERDTIVAGRNAEKLVDFFKIPEQNADFAQYSEYDPAKAKTEGVLYSFINGENPAETSALMPMGINAPSSTSDPDYAFAYMNGEERSIYNYLVNTDRNSDEYLEALRPYLNQRMRAAVEREASEYAAEKPVLSSLETIVTSPVSAIEGLIGLGKTGYNAITGQDTDPNDPVFQNTRRSAAIRNTVSNTIRTENQGFVGEALAMLYQTGMSMGDTAVRLPMGAAGLGVAGLSAAASAMDDALSRGASSGQALASGLMTGAAEVVFEKASLDNLVSMSRAGNIQQVVKNILKQGGVEASEEVFTEIANTISDAVIMADKSAYEIAVRDYMANGMTEQAARQLASMDSLKAILNAGIGGFVSGGGFGMGGSASSAIQTARIGANVDAQTQIQQGLTMPRDNEAFNYADKIADAKTHSAMQAGQQFILNQQALAEGARANFESEVRASGIGEMDVERALYIYDRLVEGKNISPIAAKKFAKLQETINAANARRAEIEADLGVTRLEIKTKLDQTYSAMTDAVERGDINAFNKAKARYMAEYQVAQAKTAAAQMKADNQNAEASRKAQNAVNEMASEAVAEDMKTQAEALNRVAFTPVNMEVPNGNQDYSVPQRAEGEQRTRIPAGNEAARVIKPAAGSEENIGRDQKTDARVRRGLEITPEAEEALSAHKEVVRRATGIDINSRIVNEVNEADAEMLDMIKSITGRDAFLYESDDSYGDGFAKNGQIFLRVNGSSHLAFLSGHEAAHADSRLVEAGMKIVESMEKDEIDSYAKYRRAEVGEDNADIERELISDMFGRMMFEVATGRQAEKDFGISKYTIDRFYDAFLQALSPDLETGSYIGEAAHAAAEVMNVGGVEYSRTRNFITSDEIAKIQNIGRKSVNVLTSEENEMLKKYAARYWMELKTKSPFFRAWFGDWRANDISEIEIAYKRGDARGAQINTDTGWHINVSGKVFNETKAHQQAQNKAARAYLPFIDDIVKKAILLDSHTVDKAKSPNTLLMHSFYAVADIGNGPEVLKLYVEEMYDPNNADTTKRAYQLKNIEKKQSSAKGSGDALAQSISTANVHNVSDLFALVKHLDDTFVPNEVSAASKNGQPITVYHGSGAMFDEFSYDFMSTHGSMEGQGFYFTDNKNMAEGYTKEGGQILEGYLSIKKPLSDNKKTLTKAEVKKLLQKIDPTGDDVIINYDSTGGMGYPSKAWYQRALAAAVDAIYSYNDTDSELLADIANSGAGSETVLRTVRQALGYDGYIVEGKYDNATVYVAFESSQFKSVNNVGTFDPQNPNFYYSRITFSDPDAYVDKDGKVMEYSYVTPTIKENSEGFYADVTIDGQKTRMTGNDKATLEAEIRELKQKERMRHLSRPVKILREANRLFRAGVTVEQYMDACWRKGEQYDVAVGRALIGMHLRNGNEVGGRLSDEKLLAITQNRGSFDIKGVLGTGAFKSLKLNMMSPVRVFEAAGAWRRGKDAETRALNYLEGEALKEVFFDPVMNAGAAANLFMERESELVKEKLEAIPKHDRQLMSSLVQLYGESLVSEEEASMARFGEEGMIVRHEDAKGNLYIYVFDQKGRLHAVERPRKQGDETVTELLIFDDNYRRRMKEAEKDIKKILAGPKTDANTREKEVQQILQRAKQNLPVVFEEKHLVVTESKNGVTVESPEGRQLLKLEKPKSPDIQKVDDLMQTLRSFYAKAHEMQSKVLVAAGYKPVPIRGTSYFPHMTREPVGVMDSITTFLQGKPDGLPTDIVGKTGQFKPGKSFAAHLLTREGLMTEYDAIRGFNRYVRAAADIIYYTPAIQRLRQLENFLREEAEGKRTDIEGAPNNAFVAWLQEYTNAIANKKHSMDRGGEALLGRESYTFTDKLTGLFGAASVSGNIATALSNNISLLTAIPGLNGKYIAKAAKDSWKSAWTEVIKGGTYDRFLEKIPFLARRFGSYETLLTDEAKMAGRKANNILGAMFAFTDRFAVETAARAKYAELMARGDPDVVRKTNEFLLKNFADRSKGMTPTIYNMRFLRLLTQFQLEGQNQFSHLRDINRAFIGKQIEAQLTQEQIREIMAQGYGNVDWEKIKIRTKDPKKFALKFLYFALLSLWGTFTRWALGKDQSWNLYGMAADFVGEVNEGDVKGAFSKLGQTVVDQIPFVQTLTGGGRIPALGGIENVIDAAVAIFDGDSTGDLAKITQGATTFLPGGAQISKTIRGIDAYARGGSYSGKGNLRYPIEQTAPNLVKSILFGPAASQPARFDYLTDTLSEKETEAYQELVENGMKPTEAYEGLQAYGGDTDAAKLTSLAEADVDEKTRKLIAKAMGLTLGEGTIKSQAKAEAEEYLEGKEKQYRSGKITKADLEDADKKTQDLIKRLLDIK